MFHIILLFLIYFIFLIFLIYHTILCPHKNIILGLLNTIEFIFVENNVNMKLLICLFLFMTSVSLQAQDWIIMKNENSLNQSNKEREIVPDHYSVFQMNEKHLLGKLNKFRRNKNKTIKIDLPLPDGKLESFILEEGEVMSPVLAQKFDQIKSFRAQSVNGNGHHARLDFGTMGFHAVIKTQRGTVYIDPYFADADQNYVSYFIKDHKVDLSQYDMTCGLSDYKEAMEKEESFFEQGQFSQANKSVQGEEVIRHKYRLAVATTGEWGQLYGSKENVMSRIVTGVNRLNMIFENEIATTFELIDNNDELIFLDPETDPYQDANQGRQLIGQNSIAINNIIGSGAYDIGHIFTVRCTDGVAGIAALGSVCLNNKGNGVSCVGGSNISAFMVNTTAHEIGHQFDGGHSWSNCPSSMGQLSPGTAWEPGSGSTILSYAGVCGSQNILGTNDDYFHIGNLEQFLSFINNTARCAESTPSGNHAPEISVPLGDGLTIPIATPFELEGEAFDEDGDLLTYNWEQFNLGPTSALGEPMGNAPSFRSFPPSANPKKLFPSLPAIIGGIGSRTEVLPLYSRDLSFRFNVRDNHPGAGITVSEQIDFKASETAGPFRVTSPNTLTFVEVGEELLLEWDVANTDNDIINCQFVDIYFSTDNGETFDIILKENTPNDGSELIEIPNRLTNEGKIKIKASNNIFFQFNRSNIIVREPSQAGFFIDLGTTSADICLPETISIDVDGTAFQAFDKEVTLEIQNVPEGLDYSFLKNPIMANESTSLIINSGTLDLSQTIELDFLAYAEGTDTLRETIVINAIGTSYNDLGLLAPDSGTSGVKQTPLFKWSKAFNADYYHIEISTNPAFGNSVVFREEFLTDTSYIPQIILDNSELYYWRVIAGNSCQESSSEIKTFGTVNLDCNEYVAENLPRNISFSGTVKVEGVAKVFDNGEVADVNILKMRGQHSSVFQLSAKLISPLGTSVTLFDRDCFSATDFNVGFDNDSPIDFTCPLNGGITMKPNGGDLNQFNGEEINGDWILEITDNQGGEGGQFTEFILELCASFEADNPYIINNDTLKVKTGSNQFIADELLLTGDDQNTAEELVYTLVVMPQNGELVLNGEILNVGDQFTQSDINDFRLKYFHLNSDLNDAFVFTVIDGDGGWIDLTRFNILAGDDFTSSTNELEDITDFSIFPNPTAGYLRVVSKGSQDKIRLDIYNLSGNRVYRNQIVSGEEIDLSLLPQGLYIARMENELGAESVKINLIK